MGEPVSDRGNGRKELELLNDYIDTECLSISAGDFMAGYRKLEKAYKEGKIKAIGISNFQGEKVEKTDWKSAKSNRM